VSGRESVGPSSVALPTDGAPTQRAIAEVDLKSTAYDLLYEPSRDRIWVALFNPGGTDVLREVDALSGAVISETQLPDVDYNGFLSRIKLGPDGSIWVSEPYRLVRVLPGAKIETIELPLEGGDAANQLGASDPTAGTWISGFGFRGNQVIVGRVNEARLMVYDDQLNQDAPIELPHEAIGPTDIAGVGAEAFMAGTYAAPGHVWKIDSDGMVDSVRASADRFEAVGNQLVGSGGEHGAEYVPSGSAVLTGLPASQDVRVAQDPRSGGLIIYVPAMNALLRVVGGKQISSFSLPTEKGTITNPLGVPLPVTVRQHVADLIVDIRGHVWYLSGPTLHQVDF
jgi:hypothetical protein